MFRVESVKFKYPGNQPSEERMALRGLDLKIDAGEFVAIVGSNGSGKSTLARHLNALLLPTEGRVFVNGLDTKQPLNHSTIRKQVGMVFQFPEDQIVSTLVEEDVAFGPANLGLPKREIKERVEYALERVGLIEYRFRPPHMLSAGQTQRLALAGVLALEPRAIIFDEATTMLDPIGRKMVMELMKELNSSGTTIIFITHLMDEAAMADRMVVMHQGEVALDGSPRNVFSHDADLREYALVLPSVTKLAIGLSKYFPGINKNIYQNVALLEALPSFRAGMRIDMNEPVLENSLPAQIEVSHLAHTYLKDTPLEHAAVRDVSFSIDHQRSHGLMGQTGSGKSTVLQHLNGILRPQAGTVRVGQYNLNDENLDRREVCRLAGLMFQNPEMQFFETYVGDEIAFGVRQFGHYTSLADRVRWAMEQVGLDFDQMKDRLTARLSGGEKRKVALASVLAWKPGIVLMDEPTAGLDPRSREEILHHLKDLRTQEVTMVVSSHQMEDLAELVETATVFYRGRDVLSGKIWEVFQEGSRLEEMDLEPPIAVRVASRLRELGWKIPIWIIRPDELIQSMRVAGE